MELARARRSAAVAYRERHGTIAGPAAVDDLLWQSWYRLSNAAALRLWRAIRRRRKERMVTNACARRPDASIGGTLDIADRANNSTRIDVESDLG